MRCFCSCGKRAPQRHHVVYQQEITRAVRLKTRDNRERARLLDALCGDRRNLVRVAHDCHGAHHAGARRFELRMLPDSAFEFAEELLGAGVAYEYLRRRYVGDDPRLEALL